MRDGDHRNGFSCEDIEDALDDAGERTQALWKACQKLQRVADAARDLRHQIEPDDDATWGAFAALEALDQALADLEEAPA